MPTELLGAQSATILSGAALSNALRIDPGVPVALQMPGTWTAANITFQGTAAHESAGVTFNDVYDSSGVEVVVTAAASRYILLNPNTFAGMRQIKLRSGTTGTPVNQGQDSVVVVVLREL